MSIAQTFADTFVAPERALAAVTARRSFVPPLLASTLAALAFAAVLVPRLDYERSVDEALDRAAIAAPQAQAQTPHEREVAVEAARKMGSVGAYAGALFAPSLRALGIAFALFVGFRLAGQRPAFVPTLAVTAWSLLPLALRALLAIPAVARRGSIAASEVTGLLPSSLAALAPPGASPRLASALSGLDLFSVWALGLLALGMAEVAGATRTRSVAVVASLWVAYLLLFHVALPGLAGPR